MALDCALLLLLLQVAVAKVEVAVLVVDRTGRSRVGLRWYGVPFLVIETTEGLEEDEEEEEEDEHVPRTKPLMELLLLLEPAALLFRLDLKVKRGIGFRDNAGGR